MNLLASVAPDFVAKVAAALTQKGFAHLVPQLQTATIHRYMYDSALKCGYVCLSDSRPLPNLVRPVRPIAHTVFFLGEYGFNVDVGYQRQILGIEILGHDELARQLQEANTL
jgi:hypothetical protein